MSQAGIINIKQGGGGSNIQTITGNSGGAVPPTANNITLNALYTNTVVGNPGTSTLTITPTSSGYPITPFVVGPVGQAGYQTIQSGLNAANAAGGGIVYVQPGTYTENLTLFGNTEIVGVPGNSDAGTTGNCAIIVGVHTPPLTGSFTFANVRLNSATHIFSSAAAGSAELILLNIFIALTNGYIFNLANWTGSFVTYNIGEGSTNNGVVTNTGGATCFFISATHGAGTANSMLTSGPVIMQEVDLNCPWSAQTGSTIACDYNIFTKPVTAANNSSGAFNFCRFSTDGSASFTMSSSGAVSISSSNIASSNNPSITGAGSGTLSLANNTFTSNSNIASTVNIAYFSNDSVNVLSNYTNIVSGVPYAAIGSDYYLSCNTATGPITIQLPNAPSTNRVFIIKDRAGQGSQNNISITTPGGIVTFDGQATYTLTANYESVHIAFNGLLYEVF